MNEVAVLRREMRGLLAVTIIACIVLLASIVPSPYSIERPGPVVNSLGKTPIEGENRPVIQVSGAETYPTSGSLNLLTVSIYGTPDSPATWLSLVPALFDTSQSIVPRSEIYPEGMTDKDRETQNTALMDVSQMSAAAAAFRALDQPVGVELLIAGVGKNGPADGVLRKDDRIVSIAGQRVDSFESLREKIVASGADVPVDVGVVRDGQEQTVTLVPRVPKGAEGPMIGAQIGLEYQLPADVNFTLSQIGGPSAGMIFAIGVYDQLTPGELLEGLTVSGTGTITDGGAVGAIGGLKQKLWAAAGAGSDLMLMPLENCADLPSQLPEKLRIVPVATLSEAIAAIEKVANGGSPAGVERCDAAVGA